MWRFNQEAVALRIQYLMNTKEGSESHTVLVTDIPVLEFGTIPHRIETTVFRYLPVRIKVRSHMLLTSSVPRLSSFCCHSRHLDTGSTACKHIQAMNSKVMSQEQFSALPICTLFALFCSIKQTPRPVTQTVNCIEVCHGLNPCRTSLLARLHQGKIVTLQTTLRMLPSSCSVCWCEQSLGQLLLCCI